MLRAAASFLLLASLLSGQEFRATILGVVADSSGALVPNANLTATNIETGVSASATSSPEGNYLVPFLLPGRYTVRVEAAGFKAVTRSPIELRVNDRTRVDFSLEVGNVAETVTVTAVTPLLEVASSSRGQVIANRAITDLPLGAHNPLTTIGLAAGVQHSGAYAGTSQYFRAFDTGAINAYSINGGRSGINEYQLDGVSNNYLPGVGSTPNSGFTPPVEAVREFKIMSSTYDAQFGRTAGGIISMEMKSGTNLWHGVGSYYLRRPSLEANTFANNASGKSKAQRKVDHFNGEIDGPFTIPGIYRGKDRTFFMFAYEFYQETLPQPLFGSIPTERQRTGDFSQTFTASGALQTIYDPLTVQPNPTFNPGRPVSLTNLQNRRQAFPGNVIPANRHSAVARRILQDIPKPNTPGDARSGLNNWFADAFTKNQYPSYVARMDHNFSSRVRGYARWYHAFRDGTQTDYWNWNTPATRSLYMNYTMDGAAVDVVGNISPTAVLDVRMGFNRFFINARYFKTDLAALGFPASLVGRLQLPDLYPIVTFDNYMQVSNTPSSPTPNDTYSLQGSLLKTAGRHSLKTGAEYRVIRFGQASRANSSGAYSFTNAWTSSNPQVTDPGSGNSVASFLLGTMASASANVNAAPYVSWRYPVVYLQDDWQVSRNLTVNLGIRWDFERPAVERFNRQNRGFDYTGAFPIQVPGYSLKGGLLFAGANGQPRGAFDSDLGNWQPRAGLAYKPLPGRPMVFRAGVGRYYLPTSEIGGTTGFSQTTSAQTSTANFLPFRTLDDPFPTGLTPPTGAALGLATSAGTAITFADPKRVVPFVWQFSAGLQYELFPGLLAEASYVGSRTDRLQVSRALNYLTVEQLALGTAYLSQAVPNPFFGILPSNTSMGAQGTIQRRSLLTQYPQFSGVTASQLSLGDSWYNSVQMKLEHRFRRGLTFLASYTLSKTMQATSFRNSQDKDPARQVVPFDAPHRFVLSGVLEIPVGSRRRFAGAGLISHIVGNWQFSWSLINQSGIPMNYPGGYYITGDPRLAEGQSRKRWFDTSRSIWVVQPADTLRTSPLNTSRIRGYTAPQLNANLMREVRIRERHRIQFKLSAYNATNTPLFDLPNTSPTSALFGVVSDTQNNSPRSVELGLRWAF